MPEQPARGPKAATKHLSLRWSLVLLVLLCWVLPLVVTVAGSAWQAARSTRQRVADIVNAAVENTMDLTRRDTVSAVNELLSVSYVPTIRQAYLEYKTTGNKVRLLNVTRAYLNQKFYRSQMFRAVYLIYPEVGEDSYTYNQDIYSFNEMVAFYDTELFAGAAGLMDSLGTGVDFYFEGGRLYLVRLLSLQDKEYQPYAVLVGDIDLGTLLEGLDNLPYLTAAQLRLNDAQLTLDLEQGANEVAAASVLTMAGSYTEERFTLSYSATADLQPLLREMGNPALTALWVVVFSVVLMAVMLLFFMRRVSRPISILSKFAGQIEAGEIGAQTDTTQLGGAEFVYLGTQMNAMSATLQDQFERLYREELALRDAEIKALQSQINPHFLGNTLEIINWEARLVGDVKVSRMLEALSTMMEATLDRRHRPLVHLSEEMAYVNAYLLIIGERLGKRLVVEKEIDETLLDWMVPRLILQPIVENAIEHGVSGRQRGRIVIRAIRRDNDWMSLEVENNNPMSPQDAERVAGLLARETDTPADSSTNIGIRNVHKRLRLLYGPQGGLTVTNTKNGSTLSAMCIHKDQNGQIEST